MTLSGRMKYLRCDPYKQIEWTTTSVLNSLVWTDAYPDSIAYNNANFKLSRLLFLVSTKSIPGNNEDFSGSEREQQESRK